jgi:phosphoglucosamine mutase
MTARRLFGTDGVRGVANAEPMTADMALRLGRAVAELFRGGGQRRIVIGKDTRRSGYMLESALTAGVCSMGADALMVGPMPTPGIAFLTRSLRADAGVVISASHNPFQDNGIKFFGRSGFKLSDDLELEMERLVLDDPPAARPTGRVIGRAVRVDDARGRYNEFVKQSFPRHATLGGLRIVVDCAHGAAYRLGPAVMAELGADVVARGVQPNGENINEGSGALHPEGLRRAVLEERGHLGVAFDGDADRALFVDEHGELVDGDETMAMLALDLHRRGALRRATVVATVMSNLGFELALRGHGIAVVRTPVGDRHVVDEMVRGDYNLGGEQSGHLVQLDHTTTGDGLITALGVLRLMVESQQPLGELRRVMERLPQVLRNVRVGRRAELGDVPGVQAAIDAVSDSLGERGRVLVRYSGTEPLLRIMVEGEDAARIEAAAAEIAAAAEKHLA